MKKTIILLFVVISVNSWLQSTIINIPADQPTIQAGINEAVNGDTILVHPGTYYENIDYLGKNITVASLEMTTGNESYIASTIINGNQSGSCVWIADDITNAVLRGFSITNGSGTYYYHSIRGGGILVKNNATVNIINCSIFENNAESGGGICLLQSEVHLEGTNIRNNSAITGGGIMLYDHSLDTDLSFNSENRCNLYNNYAGNGLDMYAQAYYQLDNIHVVLDTFSVLEPQQYFAIASSEDPVFTFDVLNGYIEPINQDFYVSPFGDDDNSGLSPAEPLQTIAKALYTIYPDSLNPKTVHIAEGIYSRSNNDQMFPLSAKKFVNIIGVNMETTIIDAEGNSKLMSFATHNSNIILKNLTFQNILGLSAITMYRNSYILFESVIIQNNISEKTTALFANQCESLTFRNVIVRNNIANEDRAGMYIIDGENTYLENCTFENNFSGMGEFAYNSLCVQMDGQIRLNNSIFKDNEDYTDCGVGVFLLSKCFDDETNISINNCLIENNYSANGERLCHTGSLEGSADITNCTFVDNSGELSTLSLYGNVNLTNNIFYNDTPYEIFLPNLTSGGTITTLNVSYCNIQNGIDGIYNEGGVNTINWLDGNLPADVIPQFVGGGDYQLSELSPCIDAGIQDTTGLFIPPWDLLFNHRVWDGNNDGIATIDMGCYEFDSEEYVGIIEPEIIIPTQIELSNYPNPFNPSTTISFSVTQNSDFVNLSIYNVKGQKVKTLINEEMLSGKHSIIWSGLDSNNKPVSSGVYLYKIKTHKQEYVKRMLLLK